MCCMMYVFSSTDVIQYNTTTRAILPLTHPDRDVGQCLFLDKQLFKPLDKVSGFLEVSDFGTCT